MDIGSLLGSLFSDYTLRTVALGTMILGIVTGVLGSFVVLRKQSLIGDAMSHATLPGIVLAFMLTGQKLFVVLLIGAAIAAWVGALLVMLITNTTRIKGDSAMGIVLSVFFGLGLVLIAALQKNPSMAQAKLDSYLLGQAATLLERDVMVMAIVGSITLILVAVFWKEFKLLTFDPDFAVSLGFPVRVIDILLTTLVVMAIAIGLQAVGVILIIAVLVAPAAAARQWTDSLAVMVGLAALFGGMSGVGGTLISSLGRGLATGPIIVLCNTAIVLISLTLAPNRGLLWKWMRR